MIENKCSHAALTKYRAPATLASAQLPRGLRPLDPAHFPCMQDRGDIKRAFQPHLARCELLNTQTPRKHTEHDTEDPQPRPVSLDMKGSW